MRQHVVNILDLIMTLTFDLNAGGKGILSEFNQSFYLVICQIYGSMIYFHESKTYYIKWVNILSIFYFCHINRRYMPVIHVPQCRVKHQLKCRLYCLIGCSVLYPVQLDLGYKMAGNQAL